MGTLIFWRKVKAKPQASPPDPAADEGDESSSASTGDAGSLEIHSTLGMEALWRGRRRNAGRPWPPLDAMGPRQAATPKRRPAIGRET